MRHCQGTSPRVDLSMVKCSSLWSLNGADVSNLVMESAHSVRRVSVIGAESSAQQ